MPKKLFVKGDPRINRKGTSNPGVAGRPSEAHRALCRELVKKHKIHQLFADTADAKEVDFGVTLSGRQIKLKPGIANRLKAGAFLIEHGFPKDGHDSTLTPERVARFEKALISAFQKYIPKNALTPALLTAVMDAAAILLEEDEPSAEA